MQPAVIILFTILMSIRKKQNIGIAEDLWNLPMTKKVVMNAIVSTGLCMDPNGFHELYMNNCYSAPELFVMLKGKYKTLTCGTVWTNRKCWEKNVMNLSKLATRGNSKIFYIPINGLIFGQCNDNKVVLFISSLLLVGNGKTIQQCGSQRVPYTFPKALQAYNKYMG